ALVVETHAEVGEEVPAQPRVQHDVRIEALLVEQYLAVRHGTGGGEELERLARIPAEADPRADAGRIDIEILAGQAAEIELPRIVGDLEREVEARCELALIAESEPGRDQVEFVVDVHLRERAFDARAHVD